MATDIISCPSRGANIPSAREMDGASEHAPTASTAPYARRPGEGVRTTSTIPGDGTDVEIMEVDDVAERVRAFSEKPVDDLAAMLADVEAKIPEMNDQMKAAAAAGDYEIAADIKARSTRLAEKAGIIKRAQVAAIAAKKKRARDEHESKKKRAREEREGRGDIALPAAADVAARANAVWDARIAEITEPLKSAQDTVLCIVKQGVELAAAGGSTKLRVLTGVVQEALIRALLLLTSEKARQLYSNQLYPYQNGGCGYPLDAIVENYMDQMTRIADFTGLSPVDFQLALGFARRWKDVFEKPLRKLWEEEQKHKNLHHPSTYDERERKLDFTQSEMEHLRNHLHVYRIREDDDDAEEEAPPEFPLRVDYILDVGYCYVPVGKNLTRDDIVCFYDLCHASRTLQYDSFELGPYPLMQLFSFFLHDSERFDIERERFLEIASSFDGEFVHSFEDVKAVWESDVTRLQVIWQMRKAGYKVIVHEEEEENEDGQLTLESILFTVDFLGAADPAGEKSFRRYAQDELDGIGAVRLLT